VRPSNNNVTCYAPRTSFAESYSDEPIRGVARHRRDQRRVRTKYNNYRYGRYEVKYTAPSTTMGNFLSTMFVFRTPTNIAWNEVDNELEPNQGGKQNLNTVNAPEEPRATRAADAQSIKIDGLNIAQEHIYASIGRPRASLVRRQQAGPTYTHTGPPKCADPATCRPRS